ncbi:MAG: ABC transporter permease [Lachnospiraceae bacterium]|nr:ABC transporter permease [Lachnospiraceae bacterium]
MKNPLNKRFLRELRGDLGKYLVIFLLLVSAIGFVSGFLVADHSLLTAYNEGFEKYNIEDGNFTVSSKLNNYEQASIEKNGVILYNNYYIENQLDNGSTLRIFSKREDINKVCLMQGKMPKRKGEIAIDRMYAENNGLKISDTINSSSHTWKITGLVALSDYSCLFQDNNDSMFDALQFGVAIVTKEDFASLGKKDITYCYSWKYLHPPVDENEESVMAENLMKAMNKEVTLSDFIPLYQNQAIQFTGEDMGGDRAMITILLYIIMLIMAFVFGITISHTIQKESTVIGTLLASGYTTKELIRHYMAMPMFVTVIAAFIGNIIGYTFMKDVCANMYYGSYSLPTYQTLWNPQAFLLTTMIPVLLMFFINAITLRRKLSLSPLKFLRKDLNRKKQKKTLHLSHQIPFMTRFRARIIFQNISNYIVLLIGILFANLLLIFGMSLPAVLHHYQETISDNMLCNYQYILQVPISMMSMDDDTELEDVSYADLLHASFLEYSLTTTNPDAEKFSAYSLNTTSNPYRTDEILLYGISKHSKYIDLNLSDQDVYISSAYAEKYKLNKGDTIRLKEPYEDTFYQFKITGVYRYEGGLSIFMSQKALNQKLDFEEDSFSGYFSDSEITDIPSKYIGSTITLDDLTKISRQLDKSMGNMMYIVDGFAMMIFVVLIYLLSKIIIEKNSQSISMAKILGYHTLEISSLYIMSTSILVVLFLLFSLPLETICMEWIFRFYLYIGMSGWITFTVPLIVFVKMFALGVGTYAVVALLEFWKIKKVPMDEALKNAE